MASLVLMFFTEVLSAKRGRAYGDLQQPEHFLEGNWQEAKGLLRAGGIVDLEPGGGGSISRLSQWQAGKGHSGPPRRRP